MSDRITSPANILSMLQTMRKLQAEAGAGIEPGSAASTQVGLRLQSPLQRLWLPLALDQRHRF